MSEESDRAAALEAVAARIAASESLRGAERPARKGDSRIGTVGLSAPQGDPTAVAKSQLPPELRILASRRARFDSGDRAVHREVFGQQKQTMAKGLDDWDLF
jgi:hypothetical protein